MARRGRRGARVARRGGCRADGCALHPIAGPARLGHGVAVDMGRGGATGGGASGVPVVGAGVRGTACRRAGGGAGAAGRAAGASRAVRAPGGGVHRRHVLLAEVRDRVGRGVRAGRQRRPRRRRPPRGRGVGRAPVPAARLAQPGSAAARPQRHPQPGPLRRRDLANAGLAGDPRPPRRRRGGRRAGDGGAPRRRARDPVRRPPGRARPRGRRHSSAGAGPVFLPPPGDHRPRRGTGRGVDRAVRPRTLCVRADPALPAGHPGHSGGQAARRRVPRTAPRSVGG